MYKFCLIEPWNAASFIEYLNLIDVFLSEF